MRSVTQISKRELLPARKWQCNRASCNEKFVYNGSVGDDDKHYDDVIPSFCPECGGAFEEAERSVEGAT